MVTLTKYHSIFSEMAYGTEMKYIAIKIGTTINIQTLAYTEDGSIYDSYEALINSEVKDNFITSYYLLGACTIPQFRFPFLI